MKRYLIIIAICILGGLSALTPEEAGRFPLAGPTGPTVYRLNPADAHKLSLPPDYSFEGNTLFCNRTDPGSYGVLNLKMPKLDNRYRYLLRMKVRGENLGHRKKGEPLRFGGVEFTRNGKWFTDGGYLTVDKVGTDWQEVSCDIHVPPEDELQAMIVLFLHRGYTGKFWYDDVELLVYGESHTLVLTRPDRLTLDGDKNTVAFRSEQPAGNRLLHLKVTDTAGSRELLFSGNGYDFKEDIGRLAPGKVTLEASLIDPAKRQKLHIQQYQLQRLEKPIVPGCRIDEHGRAIVDGKPFMPVGVYIGTAGTKAVTADWKLVADAGFNCALEYGSLVMYRDKPTGDRVRDVRAALDRAQEFGLKVIFSLVYQYENDREAVREFGKARGDIIAVTAAAAQEFSNHPALLAWYISDEKPRPDIPQILALREAVSKADPRHPTWSLTCHTRNLPAYGVSGDIIGVDPYPLIKKEDRSIKEVALYVDMANRTGLPCWVVPQINNVNGFYKNPGLKPEVFREGRFPSTAEMRAMPLLAAVRGAKGFIFYSYFDAMIKGRRIAPDIAEREWAKIVPVVQALRNLEPFILSTTAAPEVKISGCKPGDVEARAFTDGQGGIRVIAVGTGEPGKAIISVPGFDQLKSTCGQTRNLGGGHYEFTVSEADADILTN